MPSKYAMTSNMYHSGRGSDISDCLIIIIIYAPHLSTPSVDSVRQPFTVPCPFPSDCHKSMVDLVEDYLVGSSPSTQGHPDSPPPMGVVGVRICINDVTVDSTDDWRDPDNLDPELLAEELKKQQRRRSSWCPEEGRKREERGEHKKMLAISNRRYEVREERRGGEGRT